MDRLTDIARTCKIWRDTRGQELMEYALLGGFVACVAGAILGEAGPAAEERMRLYARDLGLAFQIADDLLDVTGTTEALGKTAGKDIEQGKATLVSVYGIEGARAEAAKLAASAAQRLAADGATAAILQELPLFIVDRKS